jgi:hypothetical protein
MKEAAQCAARDRASVALHRALDAVQRHAVVALGRDDVRVDARAVVAAFDHARRRERLDDVLAILGRQRLQRVLHHDQVLAHVLDALDGLAVADLTKVFERVAGGKLRRVNLDPLVHDRKILAERALLRARRLRLLARDAAALLSERGLFTRHRRALDRQLVGLHGATYLALDRRQLKLRYLLREARELGVARGEHRLELAQMRAHHAQDVARSGVELRLERVEIVLLWHAPR